MQDPNLGAVNALGRSVVQIFNVAGRALDRASRRRPALDRLGAERAWC